MTTRAAEMAKIIMEEWPEGESAESFARRRFANDKLSDLKRAVEIASELDIADNLETDLRKLGRS
jgi:hypothetical protein